MAEIEAGSDFPELAAGEVHVWMGDLDLPESQHSTLRLLLSTEELGRADRLHFPQHRARFAVGRGSLRRLLGQYLHLPPAGVTFATGLHGKPELDGLRRGALHFNVSHSGGRLLIAVCREAAVGVDVEQIRAMGDRDEIARRFFAPAESAALAALPAEQRSAGFYRAWTCKEAYLKGRGDGIVYGLERFVVAVEPHRPAGLVSDEADAAATERWELRMLDVGPGYAAALAIEGLGREVRRFALRCAD